MVILSSNKNMPRNGDQFFPYRQSSDFYYLTGITQEASILLMFPEHPVSEYREILFLKRPTAKSLIWEGPWLTKEEASKISGIENILWLEELDLIIEKIISRASSVYLNSVGNSEYKPGYRAPDRETRDLIIQKDLSAELKPLETIMKRLRMVKESEEVELMRKASKITETAFRSLLPTLKPGMFEYEIEALITYEFLRNGAEGPAYDTIVASGKNATILHYVANNKLCNDGDLLLLDFGAELGYYASDCSRTVPVNGRFNPRQLDLYNATLRVMKQAVSLMTVGKRMAEYHLEVGALWEKEHIGLGLYSVADVKKQDSNNPLWKQYYQHGTSHSIGIDVHDPFDGEFPFHPGMVLSCEPGIYIREEQVGIRLENDILITEQGPVDLTDSIPIEPGEIENLMNS